MRTFLQCLLDSGKKTENGCLEWQRSRTVDGYGRVRWRGKYVYVHRLVAHLTHGMDITNSKIDARHTCDNPPCFEPTHIIPGTRKQNVHDAMTRGRLKRVPKIVCSKGHELTEENTQIQRGHRRCRTCRRLTQRFRRAIAAIR